MLRLRKKFQRLRPAHCRLSAGAFWPGFEADFPNTMKAISDALVYDSAAFQSLIPTWSGCFPIWTL